MKWASIIAGLVALAAAWTGYLIGSNKSGYRAGYRAGLTRGYDDRSDELRQNGIYRTPRTEPLRVYRKDGQR